MIPVTMKLKELSKEQNATIALRVGCHPEHLRKIALGKRRCPAPLAKKIEDASGGLLKKEDIVTWGSK